MVPGTVVLIAEQEVAVVVLPPGKETTKAMVYYKAMGRWSSPMEYANEKLSLPPPDHPVAKKARDNIRNNHGVIPYGGSTTRYARVWPDGKEPK